MQALRTRTPPRAARRQLGLTYVEVLIATLLLMISLAPAVDALQRGLLGAAVSEQIAVDRQRMLSRLEDVLATRFDLLAAAADAAGGPTVATPFSDPLATPERRFVYLARYDGDDADADADPFTGADPGLLWVRVAVEQSPLEIVVLTREP